MLADAIRSELHRLRLNRTTVFWGVLFTPALVAVGGAAIIWFNRTQGDKLAASANIPAGMGSEPVNMADAVMAASAMGANGIVLVFSLIVAAALYAGDYRWETWRLISARNTRRNLILGKVAAMGMVVLAGLLLFQLASAFVALAQAFTTGRPVGFEADASRMGQAAGLALLSWLRIMQYAMLALLVAVMSRSLMAALFVPVVVGFAQSLLGSLGLPLLGWQASDWAAQLLMPGSAYDILKMAVSPEGNPLIASMAPGLAAAASPPQELVLKASISLALWTLAPLIGALAWFQRQDLSKE